jgi:hypothetical protein
VQQRSSTAEAFQLQPLETDQALPLRQHPPG